MFRSPATPSLLLIAAAAFMGCHSSPQSSASGPTTLTVATRNPKSPYTAATRVSSSPAGERVVRFIELLAGQPLSPQERATVLAEDAGDRQRIPAQVARGDQIIAALLKRFDTATPVSQASLRQSEMNALFGQAAPPAEDPRSMAIVQAHNRVLAVNAVAHLVLTQQSVRGILQEVATMGDYQGRPPLSEAVSRSFAQQLPAMFRQADAKRQGYMAFAGSDALALRTVLNGFSASDRVQYQKRVGASVATPLQLEQAAENTLVKQSAVIAARRQADSELLREGNRSIQLGYKIGLSPLLPH